jgi:hypothetical protein
MFSKMYSRWFAGAALGLALATSLVGAGSASAASLDANLSAVGATPGAQLAADGSSTVAAGTTLTVHGASFEADEYVGLWINVPEGAAIPSSSLGQSDSEVVDGVVGLDAMGSADDNGALTYTVDTNGLPAGDYSLVAEGLASGEQQELSFTIAAAPAPQLAVSGDSTVAAGTALNVQGTSFQADEPVGLWINVPDGASIPADSLGQSDSTVVNGGVVGLDAMGFADDNGTLNYTVDTTGLPAGNYSLVAQGLNSGLDEVLTFTIK